MNKTNINTSWLGRGAWGIVVLLVGLLLGSCEPAGPTGGTPEEPVLKTLPAECLEVETIPDDGTKTITDFYETKENCKLTEFAIPSEKDGIKITVIGNKAFNGVHVSMELKLTKLSIPNSVTSIGDYAFANNELTKLSIPNSVTSIGNFAFYRNQLTELTIPALVTEIGYYAFARNLLTSLTIPDSVETIGEHAFENNQLTELTIPALVTKIGESVFQNNKLESLTIGNSVKTIGIQAFYINQLKSITIPKSVTTIENNAFLGNSLKTVILELRTEALAISANSFLGDFKVRYEAQTSAEQLKAGTWTYAVTADPDVWSWTFKAAATP